MAKSTTTGPIEADALYPMAEFQSRSGLGEWALRQARRAGLPVLRLHGRAFIRGSDFHAYVDRQTSQQNGNAQ